jgi:hypothetical protein
MRIIYIMLLMVSFAFSSTNQENEIKNPKVAVKEVLKVFKTQINLLVTKSSIQIPYNITYNIYNNNQKYLVSEFQIRVIYKTVKSGLDVSQKNYIIRLMLNKKTDKITEEIYSLSKTIIQTKEQK